MKLGVSRDVLEGLGTHIGQLIFVDIGRLAVVLRLLESVEMGGDKRRESGGIGRGSEESERGVVQRGSHTGQRRRWSKGRRALGRSERGWREARLRFECLIRHNSRDVSKSGSVDRQELDQHMATPCCVVRAISLL